MTPVDSNAEPPTMSNQCATPQFKNKKVFRNMSIIVNQTIKQATCTRTII